MKVVNFLGDEVKPGDAVVTTNLGVTVKLIRISARPTPDRNGLLLIEYATGEPSLVHPAFVGCVIEP